MYYFVIYKFYVKSYFLHDDFAYMRFTLGVRAYHSQRKVPPTLHPQALT